MAHAHAHHGHDHGHHHAPPADIGRAFAIGVALNVGFVAVEAGFGFATGSLALVADAGHNLSDVLGLLLAWGALALAKQPPSGRRTYGWRKSSVLAALANAVLLLVAVGAIAWEAVRRLQAPTPVEGGVVAAVAAVGILVNGATALLFVRGQAHDLNARGAYLHMLSDALVSAGVVVAGVLVAWTGRAWIDPAVSLAVAVVIAVGTWGLLRESLAMALDAAPRAARVEEIRAYLSGLPGVAKVHDLHVWALSTTETALTAHLVRPGGGDDALLAEAAASLQDRFGVAHATLQVERDEAAACRGAC
jgi:cobalt-zinc-cadmium efflux system protein